MKHKKDLLICDTIVKDNMEHIQAIGKLANMHDVYEYSIKAIVEKLQKIEGMGENIYEKAIEISKRPQNQNTFTSILTINNFYYGGRQVYRFDETLSELLCSQSKDDIKVNVSVLKHLPIQNFFILRNTDRSDGFFFSMVDDIIFLTDCNKKDDIVSYLFPCKNGMLISDILLDGVQEEAKAQGFSVGVVNNIVSDMTKELVEMLQFVTYISAENAEIEAVTHKAIIQKTAERTYIQREKTEIANVGYRIGAKVRKYREGKERIVYMGSKNKGSPKSPHIRAGHFHNYWIGSKDDRKLVTKWICDIFVHGGMDEEFVSTVRDVGE